MKFTKDNLQKFFTICLVVLVGIAICGTLSGCHPCSVVQCPGEGRSPNLGPLDLPQISAMVYANNNGEIYIDIVDKTIYKSIQLLNLSVIFHGDGDEVFWEISTPNYIRMEDAVNVNVFPLHYGENLAKTITVLQSPQAIKPGVYTISGHLVVMDNDGSYGMARLFGKFGYENNSVIKIENR